MRWALLATVCVALVVLGAHVRVTERLAPVAETRAHLMAARAAVAAQDWEAAEREVELLSRSWGRAVKILSLVIPHTELQAFEVQVAQLEAAVRNRDGGEADLAADAALALWHRMVSW